MLIERRSFADLPKSATPLDPDSLWSYDKDEQTGMWYVAYTYPNGKEQTRYLFHEFFSNLIDAIGLKEFNDGRESIRYSLARTLGIKPEQIPNPLPLPETRGEGTEEPTFESLAKSRLKD